jgi:hypothetical protein
MPNPINKRVKTGDTVGPNPEGLKTLMQRRLGSLVAITTAALTDSESIIKQIFRV